MTGKKNRSGNLFLIIVNLDGPEPHTGCPGKPLMTQHNGAVTAALTDF